MNVLVLSSKCARPLPALCFRHPAGNPAHWGTVRHHCWAFCCVQNSAVFPPSSRSRFSVSCLWLFSSFSSFPLYLSPFSLFPFLFLNWLLPTAPESFLVVLRLGDVSTVLGLLCGICLVLGSSGPIHRA